MSKKAQIWAFLDRHTNADVNELVKEFPDPRKDQKKYKRYLSKERSEWKKARCNPSTGGILAPPEMFTVETATPHPRPPAKQPRGETLASPPAESPRKPTSQGWTEGLSGIEVINKAARERLGTVGGDPDAMGTRFKIEDKTGRLKKKQSEDDETLAERLRAKPPEIIERRVS